MTNSSLTLSDLSQSEKHKMYLKYPKVSRRKLESSSTEMRIFLPKLTFESLSIWKMHSSFQSLESKVFMRKVASLNSLLLGWIEQLSSMQRLWNWFLFGTHKKGRWFAYLSKLSFLLSPIFSSQRKSSGVSSKNVLKVLSDGSACYPTRYTSIFLGEIYSWYFGAFPFKTFLQYGVFIYTYFIFLGWSNPKLNCVNCVYDFRAWNWV